MTTTITSTLTYPTRIQGVVGSGCDDYGYFIGNTLFVRSYCESTLRPKHGRGLVKGNYYKVLIVHNIIHIHNIVLWE